MKIIILGTFLAALLTASVSLGNSELVELPANCGTLKEVQEYLDRHGEKVVFTGTHLLEAGPGKMAKVITVLTLNESSGSWSQFELIGKDTLCYIDGGTEGNLIPPGTATIDRSPSKRPRMGVQAQMEIFYAVQPKHSNLA